MFFVRLDLRDAAGALVADNTYWQSQRRDDVGDPTNDQAFELRPAAWADMTALNTMPRGRLDVSAERTADGVVIRLRNPGRAVAFFARAELLARPDANADELLPVTYTDNYVTVFGGETVEIRGAPLTAGARADWVRVSGYNTAPVVVPVR